MPPYVIGLASFICLLSFGTPALTADATSPYVPGKRGKGELKFIGGLPVLLVEGTPAEIGDQIGALTKKPLHRLLGFPKEYLTKFGFEKAWPTLVKIAESLAPNFPADNIAELDALVKSAGVGRELAIVGNTFADIKKISGCSTLIVAPEHSASGNVIFGRNLDYPTLGFLQDYTLVTVYRPTGKHAFASIGFPGMIGCLSGINEAGLALAVLEVYESKDNSAKFDPKGVPYALCLRRLLEECRTVDEAEKLLSSMKRTTRFSLAICDPRGGVVFEVTPANLVVRPPEEGLCACTNHFRSKTLATETQCVRYPTLLEKGRKKPKLDLTDLAQLLDDVNQGELTLQTMMFEPATLKLHLAIGKCPTSALPTKLIKLAPLFKGAKE